MIQRLLITAGPTREMLDPVRFITNLSTGEMGYAIAKEARRRGFRVTLISGPTALTPPRGVRLVPIVSVGELEKALFRHFFQNDVLIMSAAVGDFIPVRRAARKLPRTKRWTVDFRQSPDLVARIARRRGKRIVIGFSLETGDWIERSRKKRIRKGLDGMVANYYSAGHNPFGNRRVHAALIDGEKTRICRFESKAKFARRLLDWVVALGKT